MERTTGEIANLTRLGADVELITTPVEEISDLTGMIDGRDLVVDAMGWTRHLDAIRDPAYDLVLNVAAHLPLIRACAAVKPPRTVYLASRNQYGRTTARVITEDTPLSPVDVQGVHKTAAEHHWRLASDNEFACASLRFGNSLGPNQPVGEGDAGLIGGFIRDALSGRVIDVFGGHRNRNLLFAPDLAAAIVRLGSVALEGFQIFNVAGSDISVGELAQTVVAAAGRGKVAQTPMPEHVAKLDIGEAAFDGTRFDSLVGRTAITPVGDAIRLSVEDARKRFKH